MGVPLGSRPDADATLLDQSFPGLRCLRCGHDRFLIKSELAGPGESLFIREPDGSRETLTFDRLLLICDRCGEVETYLRDFLTRAAKPILAGPDVD